MTWTAKRVCLDLATVTVIMAGLTGCNDDPTAQQRQAPAAAEVGAQTLNSQTVTLTAELPGRTSAHLVSEVRPRVSGIIQSRNFVEGSNVQAGDVLYQLDPAPFQAAYRNAEAALQRANGAVPGARASFERNQSLNSRNIVSRRDLDEAETTLLQAEADVVAATSALETARINLEYTKITAPIDGRIDASSVTPGALVTADQTAPMATIQQLDVINVDVVQSSTNFLRLKKQLSTQQIRSNGEYVTVELMLEDGSRYANPGKLQFSESSVSRTAGTVTLRASFPNPDNILMPGMYVRALVEEGFTENSFLLPQRAVSRNPRGEATAKFVNADNRVEERVLAVERGIGNTWLVRRGVDEGDRIVVDGLQRAQTGQQVEVTSVTINANTGEVTAAADTDQTPVQGVGSAPTDVSQAATR
jgi:membrane fusion protein (multidrug efflux system)